MCLRSFVDLKERNQAQIAEALGEFNKYVAGLALGHDPTPDEAVFHYVVHGGPEDWERRHGVPQNNAA